MTNPRCIDDERLRRLAHECWLVWNYDAKAAHKAWCKKMGPVPFESFDAILKARK